MGADPKLSAELHRLRSDRGAVLALQERLERVRCATGRLLAVVVARRGAQRLLAGALPPLVEAGDAAGYRVDLVVGLDHGFDDHSFIGGFGAGVERRDLGIEGKGRVVDEALRPFRLVDSASSGHRVIVVRNYRGAAWRGKGRMLSDIYHRLLLPGIEAGWALPEWLLWMDAETQLLARDGSTTVTSSNALRQLLARLLGKQAPDLVGTCVRMCRRTRAVGSHVEIADPSVSVPPAFELISALHGWFPGFRWLPGGGTIGRSCKLLALSATVAQRYPSSKVEDVHASVLARECGYRVEFCEQVRSTNLCESGLERGVNRQLLRWSCGVVALRHLYGPEAVESLVTSGVLALLGRQPRELVSMLAAGRLPPLRVMPLLSSARRELREVDRLAAETYNDLTDVTADASW